MGLPFSGLRVIELGTVVSGPFAGSLLSDLGAEVIKIEAPGKGDVQRFAGNKKNGVSLWWGVASRNKQCISLDLKHPQGKALLESLVRKADVLVENYRPGAIEKLGFGWDAVHAMNPRLIMLSISGFGQTGPLAGRPGFGKILEGLSGVVSLTGAPDDRPMMIGFSLADTCTGLFGTLGVALALYHRDIQGGTGACIDVALYEPLFRMIECQLAVLARTGQAPKRQGSNDPYGWGVPSATRPRFQSVQALGGEWFLLSIPDAAALQRLTGEQRGDSHEQLAAWAARHAPEQLRQALQAAGAGIVPVLDGMSAARNEYLRARGDVRDASDPEIGKFTAPGSIVPEADKPAHRDLFANAGIGAHTDAVLQRVLGLTPAQIDRLRTDSIIGPRVAGPTPREGRSSGASAPAVAAATALANPGGGEALSGLVVLEISGSPGACFAASLLADFNATVFTCETLPSGSPMRKHLPQEWWQILARNKKSVAIDPAAEGAAEAVGAMLSHADVIVTDVPPADYSGDPWLCHLGALSRKPLLVNVVPAGADRPEAWPWSRSAELTAAVTGMMALTGYPGAPPMQAEFPLAEYLAGTLAALRTVAELRRTRVSGTACEDVLVPLHLAVHRMIEWQIPVATAMGKAEYRVGNEFPMSFTISNVHLTSDGSYIALSAGNDAVAGKLLDMIGGPELRDQPRMATMQSRLPLLAEIYALMDAWLAVRTTAQVVDAAAKHGVTLGVIYDAKGIAEHAHLKARGNIARIAAGDGSIVPMPSVVPRVVGWTAAVKSTGPTLGAHTEETLSAYGVSEVLRRRLGARPAP